MSKALLKDTFRSIWRTKARFISIIAIVALGISFFAGIKATSPDLKDTANKYFVDNNLMDIRLVSSIGLAKTDVDAIKAIEGVESAQGSYFVDTLVTVDGKALSDMDGSQTTCRAQSINLKLLNDWYNGADDADFMNRPNLIQGEYPDKPGECLIDSNVISTPEEFKIGTKVTLKGDGENLKNKLKNTEFEIVGIIESPYYISFEKGNGTAGNGKVGTFILIPEENFTMDYYPEIFVSVSGSSAYPSYSKEYQEFITPVISRIQEGSKDRITIRASSLRLDLPQKIEQGEATLIETEELANEKLAEAKKQMEELRYLAENGEQMIAQATDEFNASLTQGQAALINGQGAYNTGLNEYTEKKAQYEEAKSALAGLEEKAEAFTKGKSELEKAQKEIKSAETTLANTNKLLDYLNSNQGAAEIEYLLLQLEQSNPELAKNIRAFMDSDLADSAKPVVLAQIAEQEVKLENAKQRYNSGLTELIQAQAKLMAIGVNPKDIEGSLKAYRAALAKAEKQLATAKNNLINSRDNLVESDFQLNASQLQARLDITTLEEAYKNAVENIDEAEAEYAEKTAKIKEELADARYQLRNAKKLLAGLDDAQWFTLEREDTPGYTSYRQTADRIDALSTVFPPFFFLVAALVCLTTMTRMVEEERVQIGTLKALGYTSKSIAGKYLIYSIIASVLGSILGLALGLYLFPTVIYESYKMIYTMPTLVLSIPIKYAIIGAVIAILSTSAVAVFVCFRALKVSPSQLMRPKAPKAGKRVWLERIGFVWSHLSFTSKVTVRNLFRNKKRFIMTVTGIAGCTALILTGFGLRDSIHAVIDNQFSKKDSISMYDVQVVLNESIPASGNSEILNELRADPRLESVLPTGYRFLNAVSETGDESVEINIVIPQDNTALSQFLRLQNRKSGAQYTLTNDGVLITEKLANTLNLSQGDELLIAVDEGKKVAATVVGIVENYTLHYVYMSAPTYYKVFGEAPEFSYVLGKLAEKITPEQKNRLSTELMKKEYVDAITYTEQTVQTLKNILSSLDWVVLVFILAAGALALVVLYNLTNININERVRELATIKVLGFQDNEVSQYIYRENIFLTLFSTALGLALGIILHKFVITVAEVDMVMFGRSIGWLSYLFAAAVTISFGVLVNILMHFRLKKISMVESLKSVE